MPTLRQLTCHIEHSNSKVALKEYGTTYGDGTVETYIAIPSAVAPTSSIPIPTPFAIRLSSKGYIAPGLAMFVFIDGVYQCNRNRDDLGWDLRNDSPSGNGSGKKSDKGVEFRVRQKEERREDGSWIGRPWRFEEFRVVSSTPGTPPDIDPSKHFAELGDIVVVVLRCIPRYEETVSPLDRSTTPESAMAPGIDVKDLSTDKETQERLRKTESKDAADSPESFALFRDLSLLCDGDNGERYYGSYTNQGHYYPYPNNQPPYRNWEPRPWPQYNNSGYHYPWDNNGFRHPYAAPAPPPPVPPPTNQPGYGYYPPQTSIYHPPPISTPQKPSCAKCGRDHSSRQISHGYPAQQYPNWQWLNNTHEPTPFTTHPGSGGHPAVFNAGHRSGDEDQNCQEICEDCQVKSDRKKKGKKLQKPKDGDEDSDKDKKQKGKNKSGNENGKNKKEKNSKNKGKKKDKDIQAKESHDPWGSWANIDNNNSNDSDSSSDKNDEPKNSQDKDQSSNNGGDPWGNWGDAQNDGTSDKGETQQSQNNGNSWDSGDAWGGQSSDQRNDSSNQNNDNNQSTWDSGDAWGSGNDSGNQNNANKQTTWDSGDAWGSGNDKNAQSALPSTTQRPNSPPWQQRTFNGGHGRDSSPPRAAHLPPLAKAVPCDNVTGFVSPLHRDSGTDEPPLYTVPQSLAQEKFLTHQVQVGSSCKYSHKIRVPQYLDTIEEPYAKFAFKYRRKEVIETLFKVPVERDVESAKKILQSLPRDEIIDQFLRVQGFLDQGVQPQETRTTAHNNHWSNKAQSSHSNNASGSQWQDKAQASPSYQAQNQNQSGPVSWAASRPTGDRFNNAHMTGGGGSAGAAAEDPHTRKPADSQDDPMFRKPEPVSGGWTGDNDGDDPRDQVGDSGW